MKDCICQSCGMPLETAALYGTDKAGFPIEDYCIYCYQDGAFTNDVTMDEMIRLCAQYVKGNSRDYVIANMKMQLPRLKRWARKEETQHACYKSISRALTYIQEHLYEPADLKTIAGIARLSPYHFHRVFKSTIGESVAGYVQRLRMEYVAKQLKVSRFSLSELAEQTGYSSEQALSRAFKRYFRLPPSVFKALFFEERFRDELVPRICRVAEKNAIMLREASPDEKSWQKLYMYAVVRRLLSESCESLEIIRDRVFYPALTVKSFLSPDDHMESLRLPDGIYAIFTHRGSTDTLWEFYDAVLLCWLPGSKYTLSPGFPYVKYVNHVSGVEPDHLLSELYIPVVEGNMGGSKKGLTTEILIETDSLSI